MVLRETQWVCGLHTRLPHRRLGFDSGKELRLFGFFLTVTVIGNGNTTLPSVAPIIAISKRVVAVFQGHDLDSVV